MLRAKGENPFLLDSARPWRTFERSAGRELSCSALSRSQPAEAARLARLATEAVRQHWNDYEEMATRPAHRFLADARWRPLERL